MPLFIMLNIMTLIQRLVFSDLPEGEGCSIEGVGDVVLHLEAVVYVGKLMPNRL
jgi:hypothetical protein